MHTMSILCSAADAFSSGSWPILFKVLTLNVTICTVLVASRFWFLLHADDYSITEELSSPFSRWMWNCLCTEQQHILAGCDIKSISKRSLTGLNFKVFLLVKTDRIFANIWRENSWIYSFPKGISVMWNGRSLVLDLNSGYIHFLWR